MLKLSKGSYVVVVTGLILSLFALTWVYTTYARASFLTGADAQWRAQQSLIRNCDVGDVAILGASQVGSGVIPHLLIGKVRNLAPVAATPIDAYFEMAEIYKCPKPPKTIVLGFSSYEFENLSWFWEQRARSGLFKLSDLNEIYRTSAALKDDTLYHNAFGSEPPPFIKNWLYENYFPPYDFASLIAAKGGLRKRKNNKITSETLASGGQHLISDERCAQAPSWEAGLPSFHPNPVILSYFDRLLDLLKTHNSNVIIISPPMTTLTYNALTRNYIDGYAEFFRRIKDKYPNIKIPDPLFPAMDPCFFADQAHLNQKGAETFTRMLRSLLPT